MLETTEPGVLCGVVLGVPLRGLLGAEKRQDTLLGLNDQVHVRKWSSTQSEPVNCFLSE